LATDRLSIRIVFVLGGPFLLGPFLGPCLWQSVTWTTGGIVVVVVGAAVVEVVGGAVVDVVGGAVVEVVGGDVVDVVGGDVVDVVVGCCS